MSRKLFVGNLPYETMEQDLEALFGEAGQVEIVSVMRDRMTGRARGFAFVEMASEEDAQKAITQLNGHQLGGRALTVNEARPQEGAAGRRRPSVGLAADAVAARAEAAGAVQSRAGNNFDPQGSGLRSRTEARGYRGGLEHRVVEFEHGTQCTTDSGKARTGKKPERAASGQGGATPRRQTAEGDGTTASGGR